MGINFVPLVTLPVTSWLQFGLPPDVRQRLCPAARVAFL